IRKTASKAQGHILTDNLTAQNLECDLPHIMDQTKRLSGDEGIPEPEQETLSSHKLFWSFPLDDANNIS
ncbi:MAG TPA: hypothetical protein VFU69_04260, partial [Ktedonobacterales bacterium]|nr:hypothetical protein [Ktedonobacterales bacterium]